MINILYIKKRNLDRLSVYERFNSSCFYAKVFYLSQRYVKTDYEAFINFGIMENRRYKKYMKSYHTPLRNYCEKNVWE
jgi:hypothetical protein